MQRRRFYAPPEAHIEDSIILSPDESHHLLRVLRLTIGDELFVFDGMGNEHRCKFGAIKNRLAVVEIIEKLTTIVESPLRLTLAQALTKGEKFDFIVQKATELGVSCIVPLMTEHAEMKLNAEQTGKRLDRWQRISLEASKQSGRRKLVEITVPVTIEKFLESKDQENSEEIIFFNERSGMGLEEALNLFINKQIVTAMIGPEGGWGDKEINLFSLHLCKSVTLGRRILRTETAALAAITLLQYLLGDMSP
jgi:16S rRNA (uracil1498-N3)-methyltransferase